MLCIPGPKKKTLNDFWQMIWQENVGKIVIVMLYLNFLDCVTSRCVGKSRFILKILNM
jgi:protein tyrosine phosphatase